MRRTRCGQAAVRVGVIVALLLGLGSTGCKRATPEAIRKGLEEGLTVSGSAEAGEDREVLGFGWSTSQAWKLELELTNASRFPLELGDDLVLVESDAAGGTFEGVMLMVDQGAVDDPSGALGEVVGERSGDLYSLSNWEARFLDGRRASRLGTIIQIMTPAVAEGEAEARGFGRLEPGASRTIEETLKQGAWLKPEYRASVRVALPEMAVESTRGVERYRLVAYLRPSEEKDDLWTVERQELIALEAEGLRGLLEVPETNVVTRVFAAAWLAEVDPEQAAPAIAAAARDLRQGDLLAVSLRHLTRLQANDFTGRAVTLVGDADVPSGIRGLAATYLGAIAHQGAFDALAEAARDEEDVVAKAAIEALGALGGERPAEELLALLKSRAGKDHRRVILKGLARSRAPAAIGYLEERIRRQNDDDALEALAADAPPETFDFFAELAGSRHSDGWRDELADGLFHAGGERAAEPLLALLAEDDPPPDHNRRETSTTVRRLAALGRPELVPRLAEMAGKGDLRALQVLAHYDDEAARGPLEELAGNATGDALEIALDGLARQWPEGNAERFAAALEQAEARLVPIAARGLKAAAPDELVPAILPLLRHDDDEVRSRAASALANSDPGEHAGRYVEEILATDDDQVAVDLVTALIDHDWHDQATIPGLGEKLSSSEGDLRYQLIRLLRHLSDDAMGPETYGEFSEAADEWTKKWLEWARQATE